MELVMSHPGIVLAMIFGLLLLLLLLLAENPHLQPANEARGLTPRGNGISASGENLPALASAAGEREKAAQNSLAQENVPIEFAVSMKGAEALLPLVSQFSQMQQQMFEQFQQTVLMMAEMFGNLQREQMALIRQELEQIHELTRQLHALPSKGMRHSATPLPASRPSAALRSPTPSLSSMPTAAAAKVDAPSAKPGNPDVHVWLSQRMSELQQERQGRWQKVLSILTR